MQEIDNIDSVADIILIGKSLGGIISMMACNDGLFSAKVSRIFVCGFPIKLGFPPQIHILREKNPVLPDYNKAYDHFFAATNCTIHIIQGDCDDLYDMDVCQTLCNAHDNVHLNIVKGANHGFSSCAYPQKNFYKECVSYIVNNII